MRRVGTPSPTSRSFLRNEAIGIASIDMFVAVSASFRLLYVLVILARGRRTIVRYDVTQHPTATWLSQQVIEAFPWDTAPSFLPRDRDASHGSVFSKRLAAMGITEVVTAPRSPWQNPYVERVIGSIRRECLDHVIIFNERHLRRVLSSYLDYYHLTRTHLSLDNDYPQSRRVQRTAERSSHRHPASRRVAPSPSALRGLKTQLLISIGCVAAGTARSANLRIHGVRIWITRQLLFVQLATASVHRSKVAPRLFQFLLRDNFQQGQA